MNDKEPPVGQLYKFAAPDFSLQNEIARAEKSAADVGIKGLGGIESSIRNDTLQRFQSEIDAQNQAFSQKIADARVVGENRLGSNTALQASAGILGSNIGQAQRAKIQDANAAAINAIDVERANKVSSLIRTAAEQADRTIAEKTAAKAAGTKAYVEYLKNQQTRNASNSTSAAQAVLDSGLDFSELDPAQLQQIITGYGVSEAAVRAEFNRLKSEKEAAESKAALEGQYTLNEGQFRFDANNNIIARGPEKVVKPEYGNIVKIDGKDYVRNPDGSFSLPELPGASSQGINPAAREQLDKIDSLLNGNLGAITGNIDGRRPEWLFPLDGDARVNIATFENLLGLKELDAAQKLKGQGAITDAERELLRKAATSLRRSQETNDVRSGLQQLKTAILVVGGEEPGNIIRSLLDENSDRSAKVQALQAAGKDPDFIIQGLFPEYRPSRQRVSFSGGSGANRPQRNNNPGNVKLGGIGDKYALKNPDGSPMTDEQGHLIFPDAASGFSAMAADLSAKINGQSAFVPPNPTIAQIGKVYAEDGTWGRKVATILGVSPDTKASQIDFNQFVKAVATQEGFYA